VSSFFLVVLKIGVPRRRFSPPATFFGAVKIRAAADVF
jgi:hypothetical protein